MPMLRITKLSGATHGQIGKLFRSRLASGLTQQTLEMLLPTGSVMTDTRPCSVTYRNRWYVTGTADSNLMVDEYFRCHRQGIRPPVFVPVLAAGAGPGPSGACRVAVAFYDSLTDEWSPLSGFSNYVTLANQSRTVTNIPTTAPDSRVDFIGVWVEINGGEPRLSTMRQLGVSSITENVATLRLGIAFPDTFEKMPRGTCSATFHDRYVVAGDALHPDVLYVSAPFKPERWEQLSFATKKGEPIVALADAGGEALLAFTPWNCYVLRGFNEDDMVFDLLDSKVGAFGQGAVVVIDGKVWVFNQLSGFLYNGAFHNVLKDRETEWRAAVKSHQTIYEAGIAFHDPGDFQVGFIPTGFASNPDSTNIPNPNSIAFKTLFWTADYRPTVTSLSGTFEQPDWGFDIMARGVESTGLIAFPHAKRQDIYLGFDDGKSRTREPSNTNDNGDSYAKDMWVRTGHYLMSDPGGDSMDGKTLGPCWSYVKAQNSAWKFYAKGGDEYAYQNMTPDNSDFWWKDDVAASLDSQVIGAFTYTFAPRTVQYHGPQKVTGRGFTFEWYFPSPLSTDVVWKGIGGTYGPGPTTCAPVSRVGDPG